MKDGNVFLKLIQEKKKLVISVIVIAVLLVALSTLSKSCGAEIGSPTILGDKEKVMLALSNTVTDSKPMVEFFLKYAELTNKKEYSMSMESEEGKEKSLFTFHHTKQGKQISYELGENGETKGKMTAQIGADTLSLVYSNFESSYFTYHYKEENNGYIFTEVLKPKEVETFNESLEKIYQYGRSEEDEYEIVKEAMNTSASKDFTEYLAAYNALEFTKTYNANYVIDENEVLCEGYKTTITKEFIESCGETASLFKEDSQVLFYIYDNMLAAIVIKEDTKTTELAFLGGTYRMQNMQIKEDGEVLAKLKINTVTTEESELGLKGKVYINEDAYKAKMSYDVWEYFLWADVKSENEDVTNPSWKEVELTIAEGATWDALSGTDIDIGKASVLELGVTLLEILLEEIVAEME